MRMKSYFAVSVQTAMEEARRELGGEAILVTSRLAPAEAGKVRQYEVVFATETPEKIAPKQAVPANVSADSLQAVLQEIKGIRQQIQTWVPQTGGVSKLENAPERELLAHLLNADIDSDLAQQLLASALERLCQTGASFADALKIASGSYSSMPAGGPGNLRSAVAASIRDVFRVETGLPGTTTGATMLAMIGPPGAGKTAAVAKIAVRYGLRERKPTLLISADSLRVAAGEQLRGYAAVLGLRFEIAQSVRALQQLLEDHQSFGLILIDTPGFSGSDWNEAGELAHFLASRSGIQKHLVLPAPARCADMTRIASAYEIFGPSHLIFSRMDETTMFGPVRSQAMGSGLPVSFFTTGSGVPEDIVEASADVIAERLLPIPATQLTMPAAA
jgi:flagellar biosynthesis protein FlhF